MKNLDSSNQQFLDSLRSERRDLLNRLRQTRFSTLKAGYPQAQIVSESGQGQIYTYRFATNGTVLPLAVVVDRKAGKGRFEKLTRMPK